MKGQLHGSVPKTRASIRRLGPAALRGGDTAALPRNGGLPVDVPLPCQRGRAHDTGGRCAGDSRSFRSGQGAKESDFTIYANHMSSLLQKYILQKQKSQTVKCDGMGFLFFNFWIVESNLVFYTDLNGFILCI